MQKTMIYRLGFILVCMSLALSACGGSGIPTVSPGNHAPTQPAAKNGYPAAPAAAYPSPAVAVEAGPTTAGYPAPGNAPAAPTAQAPQSGQGGQSTQGHLLVMKPDGSSVTLTGADLQKLTPADATVGQSDQSGYKLSDVLAAAGVTDYQTVVVIGSGGSVPLTKAQIDTGVILSTVDPASLQLVGSQLSADQMVKGVNQIQAK
jgi:hypothetical protein